MMKEEDENVIFDAADLNLSQGSTSCVLDDGSIETERWAPIGQSADEHVSSAYVERDRLRELEEEQERLNNSLLSLTTHFAQVQFRLKQISQAESSDKDKLLQELQDFAFKGCADLEEVERHRKAQKGLGGNADTEGNIEKQKERQMKLIKQLREQLEDLEKFAYETGEGGLPSNQIIAKQKAVIDKLHERMQLNLELDKMSNSDLQKQVDEALKQLVNPMKAKEQLVEQLQTQIVDLERFVSFLQGESSEKSPTSISSIPVARPKKNSLLQLVGCGSRRFERNELKHTLRGNHYGDERARLQLAVDATVKVLEKYLLLAIDHSPSNAHVDQTNADVQEGIFERSEEEVVCVVRKELCPALRFLLEHGMNNVAATSSSFLSPFGCFSSRSSRSRQSNYYSSSSQKLEHIWDVIMFYYNSKNGHEFSDAPVRKLSQSFQLDAVGGRAVTSKQILLSTIENVLTTHSRLKRSADAMWKAFVCAALNEKKLPAWIRIIFRTRQVVESCYASWAYVTRTGCEDCYELLEGLQKYSFDLPVDLAVRPFHQMKDAF